MASFDTAIAGGTQIYELLFRQILQVPSCTGLSKYGCLTGNLQSDFIYALLIPHVILLLYLFLLSRGPGPFQFHKGLGTLFGATAYIFLVYSGWYGILASLLVWWLVVTLFISMGYFIFSKVIHPSETGARYGLGKLAKQTVEKSRQRTKDAQRLKEHIKDLEKEIEKIDKEYTRAGQSQEVREVLAEKKVDVELKIAQTKDQIRQIERG